MSCVRTIEPLQQNEQFWGLVLVSGLVLWKDFGRHAVIQRNVWQSLIEYYLEGCCPFLILQPYADSFRLIGLPVIWSLPTGKVSDKGVCLQNHHLEVSDKDISILVCFMCARFLYGWVYQLNDENGRRLIADHVQRIK